MSNNTTNYIGMLKNNNAIIYSDPKYAKRDGINFAKFDSIPEGKGILKTDLAKLWWEEVPKETTKLISDEEISLDLIADHEYRLCLLELGI